MSAVEPEQAPALPATARGAWRPSPTDITLRQSTRADAPAIRGLLAGLGPDARLLPRETDEIATHAQWFVVAERGDVVIACAGLALLGDGVAEVRSLVVEARARGLGVGDRLLASLIERARAAGYDTLCAFTHKPTWFVHRGFVIVPHTWVPGKFAVDCRNCSRIQGCDQMAVVRPTLAAPAAGVPA